MSSKTYDRLRIFTDAGSRHNPGNSAIACLIYDQNGSLLKEFSEFIGHATNNVAEYKALIAALKIASSFSDGELTCFMDSQIVVAQVTGKWRKKNPDLQKLFNEVKAAESSFKKVNYRLVPRENEHIVLADEIVNRELDKHSA